MHIMCGCEHVSRVYVLCLSEMGIGLLRASEEAWDICPPRLTTHRYKEFPVVPPPPLLPADRSYPHPEPPPLFDAPMPPAHLWKPLVPSRSALPLNSFPLVFCCVFILSSSLPSSPLRLHFLPLCSSSISSSLLPVPSSVICLFQSHIRRHYLELIHHFRHVTCNRHPVYVK